MPRPLSPATVTVLGAIVAGAKYGFDIMDATGLPSGTVYPALSRLERDGFVRARWESPNTAHRDKRPARRYYVVSAAGAAALSQSVTYYRSLAARTAAGTAGALVPRPGRA